MTSGGPLPGDALTGIGGIEAWGQKTGDEYKQEMYGKISVPAGRTATFSLGLPGIMGALIDALVNALFGGIFGGIGNLADLIGGFLGQKNSLSQVVNVEVPRLDNRIDEVSEGGVSAQRAFFGTPGTWTKPTGFSRHVVDVIGGGSGGARRFSDSSVGGRFPGGFAGGWTQIEFFDGDLPATVAVSLGLGGAGATEDATRGAVGGQSDFGSYAAAGGALQTAHGFGNKTMALRGGHGWGDLAPTAGTGHAYANGGAAGIASDSAAGSAGGAGNRATPSTMPYPGTGGGGGHGKLGVGNGGNGGNGGFPGGAGGGGGNFRTAGFAGNGGNGAPGAVWITSYK